MIQINLLPGHESGAAPGGLRAAVARLRGRVAATAADKALLGGAGAAAASLALVGVLHTRQTAEAAELEARTAAAVADSTRYAALVAARAGAVAERDSVRRQLAVIAEIDSTRYAWAHVMDEVSRSLPPYTWLTTVQQTSAPPAPEAAPADSAQAKAAKAGADKPAPAGGAAAESAPAVERPLLKFRVVGQTVDIQALTAFMRELETSPFVQRVQLARSEPAQVDGKEVTEFTLDAEFERPPRALLRTQRLLVPVASSR